MMAVDEICDNGILLEHDPEVVVSRWARRGRRRRDKAMENIRSRKRRRREKCPGCR